LEVVKVNEGYHLCPSCKIKRVKDEYDRCYGCERKWWKVYDECYGAGWPESKARDRADEFYPGRSNIVNS
jgi:hypothetical protein